MLDQYKGLRQENYILAFGRLVTGLGSMIRPMMTLILSRKMGVSPEGVSALLAAAMIGMAPAIYLGGRISDKRDKKLTIVILDLISTASFIICAFIPLTWISIGLLFKSHLWLAFLINGLSIFCSAVLIFFLIKDTRMQTLILTCTYEIPFALNSFVCE